MITLLVSIGILVLLVTAHELGHFIAAKSSGVQIEEFGIGLPPRLLGKKLGGTLYSLNLLPFGAFVRIPGEEDPGVVGGLASKSIRVRLLVMSGGALTNALIALVLFSVALMIPREVIVGGEQIQIKRIAQGSPAEAAGLRPNDIILGIDEQPVQTHEELRPLVASKLGSEIVLLIQRGTKEHFDIRLIPRTDPPLGQGAIGIELGWNILHTTTKSYPLWEAIPLAIRQTLYIPVLAKDAILSIIVDRDISGIGGPVGITQATGEIVTRFGFISLIEWTGVVSMTLAVTQILPIPMLDGGRIVFVLLEIVRRGKRIPPQREGLVHMAGFIVLITFLVVVTYNDILRVFRGETILP